MILVDTSIWIDHLRAGAPSSWRLLQDGYVDAHLMAATLLTPHARHWTRNKRLAAVAARLGLASQHGQDT